MPLNWAVKIPDKENMRIELFVLNYNGEEYIVDCIESLFRAIEKSSHECWLSVIDNCSADQSVPLLQNRFPQLRIHSMAQNNVLCSFNEPVAQSEADIVFLLNNDLKAEPDFIDPLVSVFEKADDAFFAAAKSFLFDGSYEGGCSIPFVSFGLFGTTCRFKSHEELINRPGTTFSAGFGAFDRKKYLEIGGYDDLYLPGRMEDADLMFRAWKKGWKCYYEPTSVLYHMGAKSFKKRFGERGTMEIAHRNTFLFMWKNMDDPRYWAAHFLFLLPRMMRMLLRGHPELITGFLKALPKLSLALSKRRQEKIVNYLFSDREVISFFTYGN